MRAQLYRSAAGALGLAVAAGTLALPAAADAASRTVRVVTTTLDGDGRPVFTVAEVTERAVPSMRRAAGVVDVEVDAPMYALGVPTGSDPYRAQQWSLARLRTTEAWKRSTGAGVTVAVIDTGVDASHTDLRAAVLAGYDATTGRAGVSRDANGHGTHVAGTIAAVTGNGTGISAVAPDVRILPVKVIGDDGEGAASDTAAGIVWAADNGAQIINMSLGGPVQVSAVSSAIAYARGRGVTVIAAAGNERTAGSPVSYPGADAGVIAVAATDSADRVAPYSNAGSYVDVAAPGSAILSTWPGGGYRQSSGTSMAAPHVAAVAALLKAFQPDLTPDRIESALERSAADLGAKGFDRDYGYGRIDPVAALTAVTPVTPPSDPPATGTAPRLNPLITTNVTKREVAYGTKTSTTFTVRVSGTVWANKPVQLCVDGDCSDTTTTSSGTVVVNRPATGAVTLQVRMAESATTLAASSPVATWTVRATVSASRTARGAMTVTLNGVDGQTVQVQQYAAPRGWETVGTYPAVAKMQVTDLRVGQKHRVVVPDSATLLGAASNAVTG
ncbi:S8 family serine peptidase [Actinoplanes sp. G11-F43]|uniref:S8 family serine peptidase n=1 Tax=Actinoplanes sp. G11-F43 TaxID=3424130 RepID=UPI003D333070